MAIQVQGTTVIDDNRNLINVTSIGSSGLGVGFGTNTVNVFPGNLTNPNFITFANSNIVRFSITADTTLSFSVPTVSGFNESFQASHLIMLITWDGAGSITWPPNILWANKQIPVLTSNGKTIVTLMKLGNDGYYGSFSSYAYPNT